MIDPNLFTKMKVLADGLSKVFAQFDKLERQQGKEDQNLVRTQVTQTTKADFEMAYSLQLKLSENQSEQFKQRKTTTSTSCANNSFIDSTVFNLSSASSKPSSAEQKEKDEILRQLNDRGKNVESGQPQKAQPQLG